MVQDMVRDTKKLGFGLMRLPKCADNPKKIDVEQVKEMVDLFLDAGFTYFDTAFVYDGGESEKAAKEALIDRYPRESFTRCTKMNAWLGHPDMETTKKQLEISLERTGAGYFDYYLLHALQVDNWKLYDKYGLWDFLREQKEKGILKKIGFSFHAGPGLLDELLAKHPETDFIQLQINYADWDDPGIASGANYEVARKYNMPVTIMEPVKGGKLADPVDAVKAVFDAEKKDASYASWAVRFAASLEGIITVLSGMSSVEQMKDNIGYMKEFRPLDAHEREVILRAQAALNEDKSIACTACHYCTDGCPLNIPIPEIFAVRNRRDLYSPFDGGRRAYEVATTGRGRASECIACGQCESACPQRLQIIDLLRECATVLER